MSIKRIRHGYRRFERATWKTWDVIQTLTAALLALFFIGLIMVLITLALVRAL